MFLGLGLWLFLSRHAPTSDSTTTISGRAAQQAAAKLAALTAREERMDLTAWAKESLAQDCARTFESLWDAVNQATNKLSVVAAFPLGEIVLSRWDRAQPLPHAILLRSPGDSSATLPAAAWRRQLGEWQLSGWELVQLEFRHVGFDTNPAGRPQQSRFYFSAHLINSAQTNRATLEGDLFVDWGDRTGAGGLWAVKRLDARRLALKTRAGEPPLEPLFEADLTPPPKSTYSDPLILNDLDGDGLPEIILAAKNLFYRRTPTDPHYQAAPLCRQPPGLITTAVMADFDGDGAPDLLCAKSEGLVLFSGHAPSSATGPGVLAPSPPAAATTPTPWFTEPDRLAWPAEPRLTNAMVLTCGDVDGDGDLDVFLAQYRVPTLGQVLRPHYYDANDGWLSYLLLNDGHGNFTDATSRSGLEHKRARRTYSASWVDLDGDGQLDLVVVSDFAGLDLYRNDGHGHFRDMSDEWVPETHAFGMAHALADFNGDGRLDLLMVGMPSPTADRLEHLNLWRPDAAEDHTMRARMTFGNRLYLAQPGGGFQVSPANVSVARSGWSWGCGAFDFDNDGFPDLYLANGLESKQTVHDYEGEFWLHDLYIDDRTDDVTAGGYFLAKYARTRGAGWSYGGYEKNRLFLNQAGTSFLEAGFLLGAALEEDCRNVVTDDLDGDGRVDLLVATLEVWPASRQTLHVFRNTLTDAGNWIGFRFPQSGPGPSPIGARITLQFGGRTAVQTIVTGDSHRSQHSPSLHFGLGQVDRVEVAEIRWVHGPTLTLRQPAINRWHAVRAP